MKKNIRPGYIAMAICLCSLYCSCKNVTTTSSASPSSAGVILSDTFLPSAQTTGDSSLYFTQQYMQYELLTREAALKYLISGDSEDRETGLRYLETTRRYQQKMKNIPDRNQAE